MVRRIALVAGLGLLVVALVGFARAQEPIGIYQAELAFTDLVTGATASQTVSDPLSRGSGWARAVVEGDRITIQGSYSGLTGSVMTGLASGVHLHHDPALYHVDTLMRGLPSTGGRVGTFRASFVLTPDYRAMIGAGRVYVDIHTDAYPDAEIRGMLVPVDIEGLEFR